VEPKAMKRTTSAGEFSATISLVQMFINRRITDEVWKRRARLQRSSDNHEEFEIQRRAATTEFDDQCTAFLNSDVGKLLPMTGKKGENSVDSLMVYVDKMLGECYDDFICALQLVDFTKEVMRLVSGNVFCVACTTYFSPTNLADARKHLLSADHQLVLREAKGNSAEKLASQQNQMRSLGHRGRLQERMRTETALFAAQHMTLSFRVAEDLPIYINNVVDVNLVPMLDVLNKEVANTPPCPAVTRAVQNLSDCVRALADFKMNRTQVQRAVVDIAEKESLSFEQ
jgi:hypothetical protein